MADEQILLKKISDDDYFAYAEVFDHYSPVINRFIVKFVKSSAIAEDLSQEIFLKIWEQRGNLKEVKEFQSYVFTLAKNHTLNFLRRVAVENKAKSEILSHYHYQENTVEDTMQTKQYFSYLNVLLKTLSPQSREVFKLCREEKNSYHEVSEKLGISTNTVKKHMVKSMKSIKYAVERDLGISFILLIYILLN